MWVPRLILWKIMIPSPEPVSPSSKNDESQIENAWAFLQPDS